MDKVYSTVGTHVACDFWGVDFNLLDDMETAIDKMIECAEASGATVLGVQSKKFEPCGYTVLLLLSESHMSIHTYPSEGFASADCYTCGDTVNPQVAIDGMIDYLQPEEISEVKLRRGVRELGIKEVWKTT